MARLLNASRANDTTDGLLGNDRIRPVSIVFHKHNFCDYDFSAFLLVAGPVDFRDKYVAAIDVPNKERQDKKHRTYHELCHAQMVAY